MSLDKFKEKKGSVEDAIVRVVKRFGYKKKPYNADYNARTFNDKVVLGRHRKLLKYPVGLQDDLKKIKVELAKEIPLDERRRLGLTNINGMFIYAVEKVFLNKPDSEE